MSSEILDIEELVRFGIDLTRRAGEEALRFYGRGKPDLRFDEDLVTEAELRIAALFEGRIKDRFPHHQLLKDYEGREGYTHEDKRCLWIYDPLDGIANFQAGIPIWGISLAMIENFWPVFGIFYMPATGDLFYALGGRKAYWGDREIRMPVREEIDNESVLLTYSRFHNRYRCTFPGKVRNFGCTAAHICYVAVGRAEAAVVANESCQDLAAALHILETAKGKISKMDGSPFFLNDFLDGRKIEDHLLISAAENYRQVRGCLKPLP